MNCNFRWRVLMKSKQRVHLLLKQWHSWLNQMLLWKELIFNQRPTLVARGSSRVTCENSTERMWELVSTESVPSGFSDLIVLGVCCDASIPPELCHALSSEVSHNAIAWGSFSHLRPLPAALPVCPVPPVVEGWHSRDSFYYSIQWVENKDEATRELIRGLGNSGSSLPSWW